MLVEIILTAVFGFGDQQLAREVFAIFDRHVGDGSPLRPERDSMRPWVAADADSPTAPPPPGGRRTVAIMDYGHPGPKRASANIGDHIQSIAALGHLVRHRGVRLHGDAGARAAAGELGSRTRPELRRDDVDADLEVITVHRDASMYQPIPVDTWVLCFGWYMHALFEMRHGFPLHRNLRPIFVSFHCNKRGLLTPAAIEYLKRHGPVGCRDWTTVLPAAVVRRAGVLLGLRHDDDRHRVPAGRRRPRTRRSRTSTCPPRTCRPAPSPTRTAIPRSGAAASWRTCAGALDLLETYRSRHSAVVTSRLHCYLPVRSIGVPADFRPKNRSDIRFDGLIGIDDEAFGAIRDGLLGKLEQVHAAILTGRPEAEVYALWRELTAADVAAAEERRMRPLRLPPVAPALERRIERAVARTVAHGTPADGAVHCAVVMAKGDGQALAALVASLLERSSRPLHVWILARPGAGAVERRLAARVPEPTVGRVPVRGLGRVTRLVLADLLPRVEPRGRARAAAVVARRRRRARGARPRRPRVRGAARGATAASA